jgi:phosphoribosylformimino-5-aminoimidazole carboxamide ribotide isomerase
MHLIPVIDLLRGHAVHARRGARSQYRPVTSVLLPNTPGDAVALGRAYRTRLGAGLCYVADLDAIQGWGPQHKLLRSLADPGAGFGAGLVVDAGVATVTAARDALSHGATTVVVGLETMGSFSDLKRIVAAVGGERVLFSLDLMNGLPVRRRTGRMASQEAVGLELAARAAESGVSGVVVLDLSAVGSEAGPLGLGLVSSIKRLVGVTVYAGGGVRSPADLDLLSEAGADGALVGTALHSGAVGAVGP